MQPRISFRKEFYEAVQWEAQAPQSESDCESLNLSFTAGMTGVPNQSGRTRTRVVRAPERFGAPVPVRELFRVEQSQDSTAENSQI